MGVGVTVGVGIGVAVGVGVGVAVGVLVGVGVFVGRGVGVGSGSSPHAPTKRMAMMSAQARDAAFMLWENFAQFKRRVAVGIVNNTILPRPQPLWIPAPYRSTGQALRRYDDGAKVSFRLNGGLGRVCMMGKSLA